MCAAGYKYIEGNCYPRKYPGEYVFPSFCGRNAAVCETNADNIDGSLTVDREGTFLRTTDEYRINS